MKLERMFRLLSVAILGTAALAFHPGQSAEAIAKNTVKAADPTAAAQNPENLSIDLELEALKEVELINSGKFQPHFQAQSQTEADPNY